MQAKFFRNRCLTRDISQDKFPYQVWKSKKTLLSYLKVFGCHAYMHVPKEKRSKFDLKSARCRFFGYSKHEKAYRFQDLDSGRLLISCDAQFMEDVFNGRRRVYTPRDLFVALPIERKMPRIHTFRPVFAKTKMKLRGRIFAPGSKRHPRTQSL